MLLISPAFIATSIILLIINNGSGIFFTQIRSGRNGHPFKLIKFKSMNDKRNNLGELLLDKERLTKFGIFIRRWSIDEFPQLINVIKGDMSIVGPRPLLPEYLELYDIQQIKRTLVKPGITGWAQVHGRNQLKLSTRFQYDVWYVEHLSFFLDLKIIFLTFIQLFSAKVVVCRQDLVGVDDLNFDKRAFKEKK